MTSAAAPSDADLAAHVARLETDGFTYLPAVYTADEVARTLELCREWHGRTAAQQAANRPRLVQDDPFVWNPQNKDPWFLQMMFHSPMVERLLIHFLNDPWYRQIPQDRPNYILRNLLARSSADTLAMHIDSLVPYTGPEVFVMQAAMLLEDQTVDNGCTMAVPGSHLSSAYVADDAWDRAVPLEGRAGDVYVWDSRIWHGAGPNTGGGTRWSLIATYCRWWLKQMFDLTGTLPQEIYDTLTDSQKAVLGFCSVPWRDETEGIDMKRGYDELPTVVPSARPPGEGR